MYSTWNTGDPALDPATARIHIPFAAILGNYIVALLLATTCVVGRIYVRRVLIKKVALDDWVLVAAYLTNFWNLTFVVCTVLVRAAIATFFLRVMPKITNKYPRYIIIVVFWLYAIFMVIYAFIDLWACGNPTSEGYVYYSTTVCQLGAAMEYLPIVLRVLTMVLDWVMTLVPLVMIIKSQMSTRNKISVCCVLVIAGIGSITSVLTIIFNNLGYASSPIGIANFCIYSIFSLWENTTGIMAISLAAMRPLFDKLREAPKRPKKDADNVVFMGNFNADLSNHSEKAVVKNV
ncbi:hypothetical protein ANO11243_010160 [Dothideomycetidae sp. 11243]|nr:hypothetical protein ANO11243_010160 [fungal sp. No.11243]